MPGRDPAVAAEADARLCSALVAEVLPGRRDGREPLLEPGRRDQVEVDVRRVRVERGLFGLLAGARQAGAVVPAELPRAEGRLRLDHVHAIATAEEREDVVGVVG